MLDFGRFKSAAPTLLLAAITLGGMAVSAVSLADDTPPAGSPPPGQGRHHDDPAWAGCKKQADDQKLQPGDARREFMKNCVKTAHASSPAPGQ
jgi:psiF repeat